MVRLLGMELIPLKIPLEKRLQMLVVTMHVLNFTVMPFFFSIFLLALLFTELWFIPLGYAIWIWYDVTIKKTMRRGGRRSTLLRKSKLARLFRDYFPISLVKTAELDPKKNYIMGYHPHGIISLGAMNNFGTDATGFSEMFPGIKPHLLTLEMNFRLPVLRAYVLWQGLCEVSKESIQWILTKQGTGNAAVIVIGGAAEALEAHPGNYNLTLKNRMGFVKQAFITGSSLVPIFSFGENDLYRQADNKAGSTLRRFQETFKNYLGFSPPLFYGRGIFNFTFGLLPHRKPIHTVVGKPIEVPQDANPSRDIVARFHQQYIDELGSLFDEHKTKYGVDPNMKLNFI